MDPLTALLLGIIQGVAEFLPVSSSGHLTLVEHLLGLNLDEGVLLFNVLSHFGTLLAIILVFRREVADLFCRSSKLRLSLMLGTLPLFLFVPLFKLIKASFGVPTLLGVAFAFTSLVLFLGDRLRFKVAPKWQPLLVGFAQTVALFPGVSRSGMTISAARILGYKTEEAIHFSFLLAIPATLGALVLELFHLLKEGQENTVLGWEPLLIASITSFIVGLFSLRMLKALGRMEKLGYFAWYCLGLALLTSFLI